MLFYTSNIQVLATVTDSIGQQFTIKFTYHYANRGLFKRELARILFLELNSEPREHKIVKVRIH